jgi:hypothetical protein
MNSLHPDRWLAPNLRGAKVFRKTRCESQLIIAEDRAMGAREEAPSPQPSPPMGAREEAPSPQPSPPMGAREEMK